VVERIERTLGRDRELEAVADTRVLDRHGHCVLDRVPDQSDVDAVAYPIACRCLIESDGRGR
jgi:hypothetical protein